jgi:catechol 2,3-dioxygenase-like lactoylglutathione lyase family enzyme
MTDPVEPKLTFVSPFFIVRDVRPTIAFYRDKLGFELTHLNSEDDPFFAMLERDGVYVMLKAILPEILPVPNSRRHPWAAWDAYFHTHDPDGLAAEFAARVEFRAPLGDKDSQLRSFEVQDPDGYVFVLWLTAVAISRLYGGARAPDPAPDRRGRRCRRRSREPRRCSRRCPSSLPSSWTAWWCCRFQQSACSRCRRSSCPRWGSGQSLRSRQSAR